MQKRIDILREIIKKEKAENESDEEEEEDEKIEDLLKETGNDKSQKNKMRKSYNPNLNGKIFSNKIQNIEKIKEKEDENAD